MDKTKRTAVGWPPLLLLLLFTLSSLPGCTAVPGLVETPTVSVRDVVLQNVSLQRGSALIRLNVTNPNTFPLPLRGVQYGLRLNGRPVAGGQQRQQRNINPQQTVALDIPVQLNLSELFRLIPSILQRGQVQYDLRGAVDLPFISIPFSRSGGVGVSP